MGFSGAGCGGADGGPGGAVGVGIVASFHLFLPSAEAKQCQTRRRILVWYKAHQDASNQTPRIHQCTNASLVRQPSLRIAHTNQMQHQRAPDKEVDLKIHSIF